MEFWGDFEGRGEDIGGKVHPSLALRIFRHLWSTVQKNSIWV